jgi:hypothetical protein
MTDAMVRPPWLDAISSKCLRTASSKRIGKTFVSGAVFGLPIFFLTVFTSGSAVLIKVTAYYSRIQEVKPFLAHPKRKMLII